MGDILSFFGLTNSTTPLFRIPLQHLESQVLPVLFPQLEYTPQNLNNYFLKKIGGRGDILAKIGKASATSDHDEGLLI